MDSASPVVLQVFQLEVEMSVLVGGKWAFDVSFTDQPCTKCTICILGTNLGNALSLS